MKRLHVNLAVKDIEDSVAFYTNLFAHEPTVKKNDYAKWSLDNPSVNFSISYVIGKQGLNHLGIEVENETELQEVYQNIEKTKGEVREEGHTVCCYATSEKSWIKDPQEVEWEAFHTYGESEVNKLEETECCDDTCCVS